MPSVPPRGLAIADLIVRFGVLVHDLVVLVARSLVRGMARRWKTRQERIHLRAMDDRLLLDIGLERHEIDDALGKAPWFHTMLD